ncbi:MAG: class I SAM-dependent methyltransferase [Bryobacterales bacterium]|nr:class I SAM-dependent methyltransferase [Bryobacteraceae bacterium]MDW8352973.1 class I SAM-dependent methyltransferase [Bryobacterales bacterium]
MASAPSAGWDISRLCRKRTTCRICDSSRLRLFLSLGEMPLANSFLSTPEEFSAESRFPLDVYFCENCTLVQLLDVVDPEVLFSHYVYLTGASETMRAHFRGYARRVAELLSLSPRDFVVEVASNDGSLLKEFQQLGVQTLGVEPARNIAEQARRDGVPTITEFFNAALGRELRTRYGAARAVMANNVLAHVDDPVDFLRGCATLVSDDGLVIWEVPHLLELIARLEYDTIYHEHLCYYSATPLLRLAERSGLRIVRVEQVPVHGGSLRMYAARGANGHAAEALALVGQERRHGLAEFARYERFAAEVCRNRTALRGLLEQLRHAGQTLAGYGAPAKGNTLLNYCGIGPALLPFTVDRNPWKVGRYTPGMHIPVLPVSALLERRPDYVLILAWNLADEILLQQAEYVRGGGRFIVPIPEPKVI